MALGPGVCDHHGDAVCGGVAAGGERGIAAGESVTGCEAAFEQKLREVVADGVDLGEILLIHGSFIDEPSAAENFDVVAKALEEGVANPSWDIVVVADAPVAPDNLGEGISEPLWETLGQGGELDYVDEVTELRSAVREPFCAQGKLGIQSLYVITDFLQGFGFVAPCEDILDRILAGEIPVGEFFGNAELVVEDSVGSKVHGPVGPADELVAPFALGHIGYSEGTGVVVAEGGPFSGKLVVFGEFAARIVFVGDSLAAAVTVEITLDVDQPAVVVEKQPSALVAVLPDGLLPNLVAALRVVGGIVGVAVVHAFLPPAECEHRIAAHGLACVEYAPGEVLIAAQILAVLVLEDDALPAGHVLDPPGDGSVVPPCVGPPAVDARGRGPVALIGHYDGCVVGPGVAAHGVGVAVESRLEMLEISGDMAYGAPVGIRPEAVPGLLERGVVAAEVQTVG